MLNMSYYAVRTGVDLLENGCLIDTSSGLLGCWAVFCATESALKLKLFIDAVSTGMLVWGAVCRRLSSIDEVDERPTSLQIEK